MKKLIHIFTLSCYKATLLIEKEQSKPLSFIDNIQLKMHLTICDKCIQYQKQSLLIENLIKQNHKKDISLLSIKLSYMSKARIQKAIQENLKNN